MSAGMNCQVASSGTTALVNKFSIGHYSVAITCLELLSVEGCTVHCEAAKARHCNVRPHHSPPMTMHARTSADSCEACDLMANMMISVPTGMN